MTRDEKKNATILVEMQLPIATASKQGTEGLKNSWTKVPNEGQATRRYGKRSYMKKIKYGFLQVMEDLVPLHLGGHLEM